MKTITLRIIVGLVVLAIHLPSYASLPVSLEKPTINVCLKLMQSTNALERREAIHDFSQQRQEIIHTLVDILNGQYEAEIKLDAARTLGLYQADEAVPALINNWLLEDQERQIIHGIVTDEEFQAIVWPISTALRRIGPPTIPPLIDCIANNPNIKIQKKALKILQQIDGDKDIVALRLQKAAKAETDAQKQARLQAALKTLTDLPAKN